MDIKSVELVEDEVVAGVPERLRAIHHQLGFPGAAVVEDDPEVVVDRDYVLAREVIACNFTRDEDLDPVSGLTRVTRIAIDLNVAVKNTSVHLSGAVAPRRNRSY